MTPVEAFFFWLALLRLAVGVNGIMDEEAMRRQDELPRAPRLSHPRGRKENWHLDSYALPIDRCAQTENSQDRSIQSDCRERAARIGRSWHVMKMYQQMYQQILDL